ncbi:hypothetical protein DICVIV_05820 [Dictyocaulus viviparus]|uniref:Uncharacterized protein n=1 Tax=Dictyocaulus viviparus TaxID=29172 RepID=A0A0D8XWF5_DICVI|nr:hypothetical protein DICVIV_05820 [Dictyocaulus viviparus]
MEGVTKSANLTELYNIRSMAKEQESPPKDLGEKRRSQLIQSRIYSLSSEEVSCTSRFTSAPISALDGRSYFSTGFAQKNPTREMHIDRVRYNIRAPADLLRRSPNDEAGGELGEIMSINERLSDGEKRTLRISDNCKHSLQPILHTTTSDVSSNSVPRGFPIITVRITDPIATRRRTMSEDQSKTLQSYLIMGNPKSAPMKDNPLILKLNLNTLAAINNYRG